METPNQKQQSSELCVDVCSACHERSSGHKPENDCRSFICFICQVAGTLKSRELVRHQMAV